MENNVVFRLFQDASDAQCNAVSRAAPQYSPGNKRMGVCQPVTPVRHPPPPLFFLHSSALQVVMFNFRGVGRSTGRGTWFGGGEQRDARSVIAFLLGLDHPPSRIFIVGYSFGSAIGTRAFWVCWSKVVSGVPLSGSNPPILIFTHSLFDPEAIKYLLAQDVRWRANLKRWRVLWPSLTRLGYALLRHLLPTRLVLVFVSVRASVRIAQPFPRCPDSKLPSQVLRVLLLNSLLAPTLECDKPKLFIMGTGSCPFFVCVFVCNFCNRSDHLSLIPSPPPPPSAPKNNQRTTLLACPSSSGDTRPRRSPRRSGCLRAWTTLVRGGARYVRGGHCLDCPRAQERALGQRG